MKQHDHDVDAAYVTLCASTNPKARREAAAVFMRAIRERNAARTPEQVSALEKARGLR